MKIKIEYITTSVETEISIRCNSNPDEKTKSLICQLQLFINYVVGYKDGEAHKLSLQDVFYIDCVDEKTFFYLEFEVFETQLKLYEWENQLKDTSFVRINKSTILNTDKLKSVRSLFGGKMEVTMINEEKLVISRHYLSGFRQKFGV